MQHRLKRLVEPHGHGSFRPSFSNQLLVAMNDPVASFHLGFRGETFATFARQLKSNLRRTAR